MVEVPSLLYEIDEIAADADFLSVGSNDLMQFLFAADRENAQMADRFDPMSPAFLGALRMVAQAGERAGIPVTVCGELGRPAGRGHGAARHRLPVALHVTGLHRPGEGDAAVPRPRQAARTLHAHPRCEGWRGVAASPSCGLRRGAWRSPLNARSVDDRFRMTLPVHKLDAIMMRHAVITDRLAATADSDTIVSLSRELAELDPVVVALREYRSALEERAGVEAMLSDPAVDGDMRELAEAEAEAVQARCGELERQVRLMLLPRDAADARGAILEVRAGTGGDEASLFAGDLFRMYQRYADLKRLEGRDPLGKRGDHGRLQGDHRRDPGRGRLRPAEVRERCSPGAARAGNRSRRAHPHVGGHRCRAAPSPPRSTSPIDDKDLQHRDDARRRRRRPARQQDESAIRITHLPTGIVVMMQEERSQHRNRAKAMELLRSRIFDLERQKRDQARSSRAGRSQVGSGDRSERIRTYNFPQGRVTDHRINLTLYKLPQVMDGLALDEVVDALTTEHQAGLLAAEAS